MRVYAISYFVDFHPTENTKKEGWFCHPSFGFLIFKDV